MPAVYRRGVRHALLAACIAGWLVACGSESDPQQSAPASSADPAGSVASSSGVDPSANAGASGEGQLGASGASGEVLPTTMVGAGGSSAAGAGEATGGTGASTGAGGTGASTGAGGTGTGAGGTGASDGVLRIQAVGDSITRATCWRALLWQALNQNFPGRFDMVGTLSGDNGCTPSGYDRDNQGYSSSLVTEIVAGVTNARTCAPACPTLNDLGQAFNTVRPDVLLMHFGTNDVWNGRPSAAIGDAYTQVLARARAANPNVTVLVAQLIPMNVTAATCTGCTCAGCVQGIPALNTLITTWAAQNSTAGSPIIVVDQYTGYDATADNGDGVHPNARGAQKMAERWYQALAPLF